MDYLKIGKADELSGKDRRLYRALEIIPGALSWGTLLVLLVFSYFQPVFVAFFIIAFDVYWLLLVLFLGIHLVFSYSKTQKNTNKDWPRLCRELESREILIKNMAGDTYRKTMGWQDLVHLVIFPYSYEGVDVVRQSVKAIADSGYPSDRIIMVLGAEERAGPGAFEIGRTIQAEFGPRFRNFLLTQHPDGIVGELKGKGANQAWAAKEARKQIIDKEGIDYDSIIVSVFDMDTVIYKHYFYRLSYLFLTVDYPHRASFQPVPTYHNNIWEAPFFARVAASSNTFWQMMQQIRQEKLATYSSHSMPWRTLIDIGFWSTSMVSEDSRIFWHSFIAYNGDYRVEPMYYPVSMDVCMDETSRLTARNLYKQQRRWGWGVENLPYLIFNTIKRWRQIPKGRFLNRIFVQFYGFHSWATNALIIGVIGWMPMILGGDRFNATVLSTNLPVVTRALMTLAMSGLVLSAIISTLLLPAKPRHVSAGKYAGMLLQWLVLPLSIIVFGSIPGLDAQTRLMFGKYLGFWVTPKKR